MAQYPLRTFRTQSQQNLTPILQQGHRLQQTLFQSGVAIIIFLFSFHMPSFAERLSLLELGIIGGSAYLPDYPAAHQNHWKSLAAPYVVYRGSIFRSDRDGARARLFKQKHYEVEMSFAGSFNSNSKDNDARRGMPDLDYLGEVGPRLSVPLGTLGWNTKLKLYVPVRAVFSSDLTNLKHRGFTFSPNLTLIAPNFIRPEWIGFSAISSTFANRQLSAYFYDVAPEFALPSRPTYDARGGYLGSDFSVGLLMTLHPRWKLFLGSAVSYYEGTANTSSPLFRDRLGYTGVVGVAWIFYISKRRAADYP